MCRPPEYADAHVKEGNKREQVPARASPPRAEIDDRATQEPSAQNDPPAYDRAAKSPNRQRVDFSPCCSAPA